MKTGVRGRAFIKISLSTMSADNRSLRNALRNKKRDYVGKFPNVGPPPPDWERPVIKKKKLDQFVILGPKEHFWF